jgi:SsrA-binding protein
MLDGTEVKSLRAGRASLQDSYAGEMEGELYLFNAYIPEYQKASQFNHETKRPRKMLVHKRERDRLLGAVRKQGVTLVPLDIHFNDRGIAKVELGVATGKKKHDKRETEKKRSWDREKARLLREKG